MRNVGLEEAQAGIKIGRKNINNLRYADDTNLVAEKTFARESRRYSRCLLPRGLGGNSAHCSVPLWHSVIVDTPAMLIVNHSSEYIMRNAGLEEAQTGIKIARRNINNLRYADDTTLMTESEEELKSLLMKVKEAFEFLFTFCHKGGVICKYRVIDISPANLDSSLCFIQSCIFHYVLCIRQKVKN